MKKVFFDPQFCSRTSGSNVPTRVKHYNVDTWQSVLLTGSELNDVLLYVKFQGIIVNVINLVSNRFIDNRVHRAGSQLKIGINDLVWFDYDLVDSDCVIWS